MGMSGCRLDELEIAGTADKESAASAQDEHYDLR